jgi:hypothetical protein
MLDEEAGSTQIDLENIRLKVDLFLIVTKQNDVADVVRAFQRRKTHHFGVSWHSVRQSLRHWPWPKARE